MGAKSLRVFCFLWLGFVSTVHGQRWPEREPDDAQERREEWFYRQRAPIPDRARLNAIRRLREIDSASRQRHRAAVAGGMTPHALTMDSANWTAIGPRPTGGGSPSVTSGRVNAVVIDPRDSNVVYIGAAEGGVWKTTDGGANWTPLTDDQASLAHGAIALDPGNPDVVYVGTGEENFAYDSYYGIGILKSTDAGATWTNYVGPFSRHHIGALAVQPGNGNTVLAADEIGIWRSTDGAQTWTQVLTGAYGISLVFDPGNPSSVYATLGTVSGSSKNGVYHSTDGGLTWKVSNGAGSTALPSANVGRVELAMAPSNPAVLYAQIQNSATATFGGLLGIYKTTDGGATWNKLPVTNTNVWGSQLWYDNTLRVSPTDENVVYAGALQIYRTIDGGNTWTPLNQAGPNGTQIHVDFHGLAFTPDGTKLYLANDGGVYSTTDITARSVNWKELNDTLAITQFYPGMAVDPGNPLVALAGTQDNGTQFFSGDANWEVVTCGDGAATVIDQTFGTIAYSSCGVLSGASLRRSTAAPGAGGWVSAIYGIDQTDSSGFIAPLVVDPNDPRTLYFGTYRLWRSTDGAGRWSAVSQDLTGGKRQGVTRAIAVAPSDSNTVYVGTNAAESAPGGNGGKVQVTRDVRDGGSSVWTDVSKGLPPRAVTQIKVDPVDAGTAYVTFSGFTGGTDTQGHVFHTTDAGATWTDISGDLPNIPVNDIVVDPDLPQTLYLGTDAGVMVTINGGANWSTLGNGMPKVVVHSVVLHRGSRVLRAATHGRGVFDIRVPLAAASLAPVVTSVSPASANPGGPAFTITVTGSNFNSGTTMRWNGEPRPTTFVDATHVKMQVAAADVANVGRAALVAFNAGSGGGASNAMGFLIGSGPVATAKSVVSAANPLGGNLLAPRSIATVYGLNLASQTAVADLNPPWPFTLGDTTLSMLSGTQPVPLYAVSATQISFQVPQLTLGSASLTITQGVQSTTIPVTLVAYAPAIFTTNEQGSGQASALISNTASIAAPVGAFPDSRPAKIGEYISIFCTGLGDVNNRPALGSASPSNPLANTLTKAAVTVGGVPAEVQFSGLAPGFVGLYQVNVKVPDGAPTGPAVDVVISIGGAKSNTAQVAVDPS